VVEDSAQPLEIGLQHQGLVTWYVSCRLNCKQLTRKKRAAAGVWEARSRSSEVHDGTLRRDNPSSSLVFKPSSHQPSSNLNAAKLLLPR
jgi:hypothetical protein